MRPPWWVVAGVLAPILAAAAVLLGAWWAPFPLGLAFGWIWPRFRTAAPVGALTGLAGWVVPLVVVQSRYGAGPAAQSISAILGLGHQGAFAVALTLLVGVLLGFSGSWLGSAIRSVLRQPRPLRQPAISRKTEPVSSEGSTPSSAARSLRRSK